MALAWLPERPEGAEDEDCVFSLPTPTAVYNDVKWIAKRAGITKDISFHTSRHTFATLTLSACNDIKSVSKLLGHKSVLTTQVYAEVLMADKVSAINNVNGQFGTKTYEPKPPKPKPAPEPKPIGRRPGSGRTREQWEQQYKQEIALLKKGVSVAKVAEQFGKGKTTIGRVKREFCSAN